ncbi:hypothetical protein CKO_02320 [Citrobacter koseri ATCC BAA-895]|uniref:Uncharacterized protein n=1 Tax=Citrobacter koseri (strain ATCC BAA-895 / CDC 4225-83 / SGSC4696) TaxID=290338 RepID=A8AIX8_CITK8|nr:hypothetical protein CKO_02320 [Citrobacter koseri ATCC BAA-895]
MRNFAANAGDSIFNSIVDLFINGVVVRPPGCHIPVPPPLFHTVSVVNMGSKIVQSIAQKQAGISVSEKHQRMKKTGGRFPC